MDILDRIETDETWRREQFPSAARGIFLAHAAVAALPKVAVDAMDEFNRASATGELDFSEVFLPRMDSVRESAARLIGAGPNEIALLGPTSLGLSLVANGLDWRGGDEVICYLDDYPANVYPWTQLERFGVRPVFLKPERPGRITPELVAGAMTDRTRLVALASCHFFSGYGIDVDAIGRVAHEGGALFCLDAIQSLGAFPVSVEQVDFLSADAHKWMLGPLTAGIFYVSGEHQETLRPSLYGAWNVSCPNFVARETVDFEKGGRRYEPGVLNAPGLLGMQASIELLREAGIDGVSSRILSLKSVLVEGLKERGFEIVGPEDGPAATGITSFGHPAPDRIPKVYRFLAEKGVVSSLRHDREGRSFIRFSHHFCNTADEIKRVLGWMEGA